MVLTLKKLLFASIFIAGCSESAGIEPANTSSTECTFQFGAEAVCSYKAGKHAVKASLVTKKLADDEIALIQANVVFDGKKLQREDILKLEHVRLE